MEFDKSKVYSLVNADELPLGSTVIVSDTLADLRDQVELNNRIRKVYCIAPTTDSQRIGTRTEGHTTLSYWNLAYLLESPPVLEWTAIKLGDQIRRKDGTRDAIVTCIDRGGELYAHICAGGQWLIDKELRSEWELKNRKEGD